MSAKPFLLHFLSELTSFHMYRQLVYWPLIFCTITIFIRKQSTGSMVTVGKDSVTIRSTKILLVLTLWVQHTPSWIMALILVLITRLAFLINLY